MKMGPLLEFLQRRLTLFIGHVAASVFALSVVDSLRRDAVSPLRGSLV